MTTSENHNSPCSFTASQTEQNTYNCKTAHIVNILILCTSTERQCAPPFCRASYNDTINWRSGKHRIFIFDENNRFQRKWKYWEIKIEWKSLVKQQILMYKTAVYRLVTVGITHQKQQISEKGDIARQYIDT